MNRAPAIPQEWRDAFDAAAARPLDVRLRYAFVHTYKLVLDDAPLPLLGEHGGIPPLVQREPARLAGLWDRLATPRSRCCATPLAAGPPRPSAAGESIRVAAGGRGRRGACPGMKAPASVHRVRPGLASSAPWTPRNSLILHGAVGAPCPEFRAQSLEPWRYAVTSHDHRERGRPW